jgi:hypothetical protein
MPFFPCLPERLQMLFRTAKLHGFLKFSQNFWKKKMVLKTNHVGEKLQVDFEYNDWMYGMYDKNICEILEKS